MNSRIAVLLTVGLLLVRGGSEAAANQTGRSIGAKPIHFDSRIEALVKNRTLNKFSIRVEKSRYLLTVMYENRAVKSYPVVLGTHPVEDKQCEGDARTPEGVFSIVELRSPHKWTRFLLLNYPTSESKRKFQRAKAAGKIPATARIGGDIGIHGVPDGYDSAIDRRQNWTLGCISLKTSDIQEVYSDCRKGTKVQIIH